MALTGCSDYRLLDVLIKKNIPFALYKYPNNSLLHFVMQTTADPKKYLNFEELSNTSGFVIAPFSISTKNPIVLIEPEIELQGEESIFSYITKLNLHKTLSDKTRAINPQNITFGKYQKVYSKFHEALVARSVQKLVLSRTKEIQRSRDFSAGETFKRACQKYPNNFIFLCHTSITGTWLGCSPEILLSKQKSNQWNTVALAGTQKCNNNNNNLDEIVWDTKNIEEQRIVVEYMKKQLQKVNIAATISNPQTIKSGGVVHLKSNLSFTLPESTHVGSLLELLHPSPAVCGFPKQDAFDFILKNENYDRNYYSGFIGALNLNKSTNIYVNLRSMQIDENMLQLYAGGGILSQSEVKSEWLETEHKLDTLLSIIGD